MAAARRARLRLRLLAAATLLVPAGLSCSRSSAPSVRDAEVMSVELPAGDFDGFALELSGNLPVSQLAVNMAACSNIPAWLSDRALDLVVIVATDPSLTAAAELVSHGDFNRGFVESVVKLQLTGHPQFDDAYQRAGITSDQLARFEQALEAAHPSEQEHFVAYAVRVTLSTVVLHVIDISAVDAQELSPASEYQSRAVTYVDGAVVTADCEATSPAAGSG
ncbi:MAG: hypothetical protein R2694_18050 [Ilumatobacteraceae bacterium]|nr:hypothetical protein [Ilumatobacter sp.]MCB9382847.1 hypothetical protein [Acidimicrobiaceae bacterium]